MDTSQPDPGVSQPAKRSWRRHSDEFKSQVIAMARQGHGSVAAVALANGLNANMLRRWVRESEMADTAPPTAGAASVMSPPAFMPVKLSDLGDRTPAVPVPAAAAPSLDFVTVEIRRGTTSVSASLPMDTRSAAWLRDVLA